MTTGPILGCSCCWALERVATSGKKSRNQPAGAMRSMRNSIVVLAPKQRPVADPQFLPLGQREGHVRPAAWRAVLPASTRDHDELPSVHHIGGRRRVAGGGKLRLPEQLP